jgi:multiple RNA-binding domain-containing protein 1
VADAMAKKLGVKKADILNHENSDMAVKLALAETTIINETKAYLESVRHDFGAENF